MINEEIAQVFERMSNVLAFKGADRFRVLAYDRAATSLRDFEGDLAATAAAGKLDDIPGIGKDLSEMIQEYLKTHRIRRFERECRGIPDGLIDLMDVPGLGPKTLALLHKQFHIKGFEDLKRTLDSGALLKVQGFGEKKVENLRRGITLWLSGKQRMPLGIALPLAEELLAQIRKIKLVERADVAGSIRRRRETIGDLDILISSSDSARALKELTRLPLVKQVLALGETRATAIIEGGIQVDIRSVATESYGAALQYFTGSKQHNVHLRTLAREKKLKFNEYGVFSGEKRVAGASEEDVYATMDLPVPPPELREDRGEIEAALNGKLPTLIEVQDLRGDLHAHTNYSDGRSTIEEMVVRAAQLGYEYIALADHSPSARIARGLDLDRLEEKIKELEKVRKKRSRLKPRILLGAEVDILADGKLDYPDDVLRRFEVVTASVHAGFKQTRDRMTGRLLDAIANPYVHILGHPTTRLIGSREGVEFDFDKVVSAAVDAGVALEVNGSPFRLDITDTMARAAVEAGAVLAINSDAHSASQLDLIRFGVYQARRGWVEVRDVVNAWAFGKLNRWLAARRKR
ncbi:MAG TPA: DNA polymerase/3'-5' exonuclease PolX [Blastocatellia bacterium]|nr:DNA polymerase/3'-5' exonuclease PolX [Blastocatellia bacterium]